MGENTGPGPRGPDPERDMGNTFPARALFVAAALAGAAASVPAHEEAALDLGPLADHVADQAAATAFGPAKATPRGSARGAPSPARTSRASSTT
jgi:hypothetical protein